ncbi:MAG TPA: tetratricopeptide repeat protein, partial [Longimicrobium sp.]|nr:tetratricopeptide repeat protein [Longimicrobium sp.]
GRAEYLRRLARLGDGPLKDLELSRWAWNEVLGESPLDAGAQRRLAAIARKTGESQALLELLVAQLDREPRGLQAREAWRERVAVLEKLGRGEEAVEVLRQAVRFEPGHKEAWLLLADRLAQRGKNGEAAWAYEHGATTTEDESERQQAWVRLARFARDVLKDPAKAQVYAARAENLRQAIEEAALLASAPLVPLAPRTPPKGVGNQPTGSTGQLTEAERRAAEEDRRVGSSEVATDPGQRMDDEELDDDSEDGALLQGVLIEEETELGHQRPPATEELEPSEIVTGKAPVFPGRRTEQIQRPQLPDPESPQEERAPQPGDFDEDEDEPEPTWGGAYPSQAQEDLFQAVHERPLDPEGYLALADYFEDLGDAERGGLMAEIATALEGDPAAAPRAPKLMLSAPDRSSLRHPFLRGPEGELLSLVGVALCRLFAPEGSPSGDEFRIDSGRGAGAAAEALQAAVRILGVRAPEVFISPDIGPPFSLTFVRTPRLLVGRAAVDRQLPEAELRFFAGRALFAQNPDLLALRQLTLEQLEEGLGYLDLVLRDSKDRKAKVRALRELLPKKGLDVVRQLHGEIRDEMDLALMSEGARHSANRAGLVVCGGVAPAITALRAKRAPEEELMELVRFAASERYLKLRQRRLG